MSATTIKLEGKLLKMIEMNKDTGQSVSAFVRETLERAIRERQRARAADVYNQLVAEDPEEAKWLAEWEGADLASDPVEANH